MKLLKILLIPTVALSVSACSSANERMCKKAISEQALNPETIVFKEFEEIPYERYWSMRDADANILAKPTYDKYIPHYKTYRMRVQAQGKLGNTITSVKACMVEPGAEVDWICGCWDVE